MFCIFRKPIFGLDISDFSIEVLQINRRKKIKKFGRIILEKGIVENGFILNKEKLIQEIEKVLNKSRIKARNVILALPDSKTFICIFKIPRELKKEQIEDAVRSEAEKTIPLEIEKLYWDYKITSQTQKEYNVLFAGTLKEVVDDYLEILKKLKVNVVAIEPESLATGRALLEDKKLENSIIILDIGAKITNVSIFDKYANLHDSVTVDIGGQYFTSILAKELSLDLKKAEKIKRKVGFDEKKDRKVALLLKKAIRPLIKEIERIIEYHGQKVQMILVTGGSSQLPKIENVLFSSLGIKVKVSVASLASQLKKSSALFNTVAGLALRGIEKDPLGEEINLLPSLKEKKKMFYTRKDKKDRKKIYRVLEIILLFIFAVIFWIAYILVIGFHLPQPLQQPSFKEIPSSQQIPHKEKEPHFKIVPKEGTTTSQATTSQATTSQATTSQATTSQATTSQEIIEEVIIQPTETGWLNVRMGPGTQYPVIKKIYPGESYPLLDEFDKWYKIEIEKGKAGWIFSRYAKKQ